jgi:MoxR-like ATPase
MSAATPASVEALSRQVTAFVQELRRTELYKVPGVAETLDWTAALVALDQKALDESVVRDTLGVLLKYQDDLEKVAASLPALVDRVRAGL